MKNSRAVFNMDLAGAIHNIPHFLPLRALSQKQNNPVWLVGGFLRDHTLKRDKARQDFDFCVAKGALGFAKGFAAVLNAKLITLDEGQETYRVVVKAAGAVYTYDFTSLRGKDLHADLRSRDFTINSLAVLLTDRSLALIDLCGSRRDLKRGIIRTPSGKVLFDDPLRIVRGFTFMAHCGFKIEARTLAAMKKYKARLKNVSGERLGEELLKILDAPDSFPAVKLLSDTKIIDMIIPAVRSARGVSQGGYHHLDVWRHSLETLRCFERLVARSLPRRKAVMAYLQEEIAKNRRRIQIVKLACLLHDIGKPLAKARKDKRTIFYGHEEIGRKICRQVARRLKLSTCERLLLENLVFWHLRPGYLADTKVPTARALYRYFRDTDSEGAGVAILSVADWHATRGRLAKACDHKHHARVMLGLVDDYFSRCAKKPLPKIVDGYDIMKQFGLKPSPIVGKVLNAVREEQALGNITTRDEAFSLAKDKIANLRGSDV